MKIEQISHFLWIHENFATAGQPTEEQLRSLLQAGFQVVINLGLEDADYAVESEAHIIRSAGAWYYSIPVSFQRPSEEDYYQFVQVLQQTKGKKIFVHCAANKRVSVFVALFQMQKQAKSYADAMNQIEKIWTPDKNWQEFMRNILLKYPGVKD